MVKETQRTALLDVQTAFRTLDQARQTVESFQAGRLDNAKELLTMAQTGYDKRASTYLELLDAQQVYRSEQVEYARALAAYNAAKAALQRAVGGQLP
jgi:outer membrane protein TolC